MVKSFVNGLASAGAGLSNPDIFLDEPGLNGPDGLYAQYPVHSGTIPLAPSVMQSNYVSTTKDGTGREPSVAELLTFARHNLKANYIFWTRAPGYSDKVLNMLHWKNQTSDPAGGLDTTCPTAFSSCVD